MRITGFDHIGAGLNSSGVGPVRIIRMKVDARWKEGITNGAFKAWKQEAALPFPVGCLKGESEKARATWGAGALRWLILTDKAHRVTAEGFPLEELDAKLAAVAK